MSYERLDRYEQTADFYALKVDMIGCSFFIIVFLLVIVEENTVF